MSWRRLTVLVAGVSPTALYRHVTTNEPVDLADITGDDPEAQAAYVQAWMT